MSVACFAQSITTKDNVAEGRRLMAAGDYNGAVRAFDAALKDKPNDATATSELGWALYKAKDYKRAEDVTLKAIMASSADAKLRAAGYYNLGRIYEDTSQRDAAIDAYRSSEKARPSKAAEERIAALSGGAKSTASGSALEVSAMAGPFDSTKAAAAALKADCEWNEPLNAKVAAPYEEAKLGRCTTTSDLAYQFALRVGGKWYTSELYSTSADTSGRYGTHTRTESAQLTAEDLVAAGPKALAVSASIASVTGTDEGEATDRVTRMLVCGIGASHKPSCTASIPVATKAGRKPEQRISVKFGGGAATIAKVSASLDADQKSLTGRRTIAFE